LTMANKKKRRPYLFCKSNLHVMVTNDDRSWFAQGLEIDYAVEDTSLKDMKQRFQEGVALTAKNYLKIHGNIKALLVRAPADLWNEFYEASSHPKYVHVSLHPVDDIPEFSGLQLPFKKVEYVTLYKYNRKSA